MQQSSDASERLKRRYRQYMVMEKGFSAHTVDAYERDVAKWFSYTAEEGIDPLAPTLLQLHHFTAQLCDIGIAPSSRKRILSGIHSFFRFCCQSEGLEQDPMELFDFPDIGAHLPEVLSVDEVDTIEASIDLSSPWGHRNKAIIEVLFSCGLRVSELSALHMSDLFLREGFLRINGKGSKQRLVPISPAAQRQLELWLHQRNELSLKRGEEDFVFISKRGRHISRTMVFVLIKQLAAAAGIDKNISPHTFRHSFATALLEGGASLRAIQAMLGHESISTTEIYLHTDVSHLREEILQHHPREIHSSRPRE